VASGSEICRARAPSAPLADAEQRRGVFVRGLVRLCVV